MDQSIIHGIRTSRKLEDAGWERRYLADPARTEEAIENYTQMGFEVHAEELSASDFGEGCSDCASSVCQSYVLIYTRKKGGARTSQMEDNEMEFLQPSNWAKPKGYSNGISTRGTLVFVAGQVGWDENEKFQSLEFVPQVEQALKNIVTVLAETDARPEHIARMTWYVTDKKAYLSSLREVGKTYREIIGRHYPTMSLVIVAGLVEEGALVEIEATAVLPEKEQEQTMKCNVQLNQQTIQIGEDGP